MSKRIGLLVNPSAGRGRAASVGAAVAARLAAQGHEVVDVSGPTADAARDRTRRELTRGLDTLAVVGGDGVVHLGVNLCAGTGTPLAVVAAGAGNDIARGLALPLHDPVAAARMIVGGRVRTIDAVRVHEIGAGSVPSCWFAGVLGAGFDSVVNERANGWAWPRGAMRYNLAIARELPFFRAIPYVIEVDGVRREAKAMLVAVANGPSYGGGMRVCPDARFDHGLLDVLIVHEITIPAFLRVFPKVFTGRHVTHPRVELLRGRQVRLEAPGVVAYADGERLAALPLACDVVPGALRVLVPQA